MVHSLSIWVLLDDKVGHQNQALGVAEALGFPYTIKQLAYHKLARLPNSLKQPHFGLWALGVDTTVSDLLVEPWPDLVIACGRKTAPIACYIKRASKGKTRLIHIMWPSYKPVAFDLIALPEHDGKHGARGLHTTYPTLGAPHRLTKAGLTLEQAKWAHDFKDHISHNIAVFVGGDSGKISWKLHHMRKFISYLETIACEFSGTIYVATSRRTPATMVEALQKLAKSYPAMHLFVWQEGESRNPYQALIARADGFLLTGDSINIVTESCYRGRPVCAHMPWDLLPKKHLHFLHAMIEENYLIPLNEKTLHDWLKAVQQERTVPALPNPALVIAEEIMETVLLGRV